MYKIKIWSKQDWEIDLCGKLGILMTVCGVFYFMGYWGKYIELAPLLSLGHNIFGTFLIVNGVFCSGERGTSPGSQEVNGEQIMFSMMDPALVRLGINYLVIGYVIQILVEVKRILT